MSGKLKIKGNVMKGKQMPVINGATSRLYLNADLEISYQDGTHPGQSQSTIQAIDDGTS